MGGEDVVSAADSKTLPESKTDSDPEEEQAATAQTETTISSIRTRLVYALSKIASMKGGPTGNTTSALKVRLRGGTTSGAS